MEGSYICATISPGWIIRIFIFQVIHPTFPHPQISGTSQREARPAWPARPGRRPVAAWLVKGRGRPESSWGCGTPRGNGWKPPTLVLWVDGSPFPKYFQVNQKPLGWLWEVFRGSQESSSTRNLLKGDFKRFFFVKGCSLGIGFFGQWSLRRKKTPSVLTWFWSSRLYFLMQIDSESIQVISMSLPSPEIVFFWFCPDIPKIMDLFSSLRWWQKLTGYSYLKIIGSVIILS